MTILISGIFGIIQGLGEMLPISSSAHLVLFPYLFGIKDPGLAFDVALHFGSLIAVVVFFWKDWVRLFFSGIKLLRERKVTEPDQKLLLLLAVASVPGAVFGLLLDTYAETTFRNPLLIAATLVVMGTALYFADHTDKGKKTINTITLKDAMVVGLAQAFAIIPGVSRSGATITAGLISGINKEDAARFSFLMSAPIILGAAVAKVGDISSSMVGSVDFWVAITASAISSVLAIGFLLRFVRKNHFDIFVYYRYLLAAVVVIIYLTRG